MNKIALCQRVRTCIEGHATLFVEAGRELDEQAHLPATDNTTEFLSPPPSWFERFKQQWNCSRFVLERRPLAQEQRDSRTTLAAGWILLCWLLLDPEAGEYEPKLTAFQSWRWEWLENSPHLALLIEERLRRHLEEREKLPPRSSVRNEKVSPTSIQGRSGDDFLCRRDAAQKFLTDADAVEQVLTEALAVVEALPRAVPVQAPVATPQTAAEKAMHIETDPVLLADPLWRALEGAKNAFASNPGILHRLIPDAEDGLNAATVNRLAKQAGYGPVFKPEEDKEGEKEGEKVVARRMVFFHPNPEVAPICFKIMLHNWPFDLPPHDIERAKAYLAAWQQARAEQLRPAAQKPKKPKGNPGRPRLSAAKQALYENVLKRYKGRSPETTPADFVRELARCDWFKEGLKKIRSQKSAGKFLDDVNAWDRMRCHRKQTSQAG